MSPVVAPYGHHAGADFVAQFQGEHGQQHDGGGTGEDGSRPEAGTAEPASPAAVRGAGTTRTRLHLPPAGSKTARDRDAPLAGLCLLLRLRRPAQLLLKLRGGGSPLAQSGVGSIPVMESCVLML